MAESFCTNCGTALADDARFCAACGKPRSAADGATPPPPPPPPPAPMVAPGQPYAAAPGYATLPRTNGFAIASLVCSLVGGCGIGSILALVFGYIARRQIVERGERGSGMALAGIIIGWIGLAAIVLWFIILMVAAGNSDTGNY